MWLFKIIVFACELESMAMVVTPVIKILFQQNYWKEFLNLGKFLREVRAAAAQNWSFTATTPTFEPLSSEGCHLYITLWHMWMHASTQRSPNVLLQASLELFSTFHLPHRVIQIGPRSQSMCIKNLKIIVICPARVTQFSYIWVNAWRFDKWSKCP